MSLKFIRADRMTAAIGHPTLRPIRVRIGHFWLGGLLVCLRARGGRCQPRKWNRRLLNCGLQTVNLDPRNKSGNAKIHQFANKIGHILCDRRA